MSCKWNVHCLDCNTTKIVGEWTKNDPEAVAALCKHAGVIAALAPVLKDVHLTYAGIVLCRKWSNNGETIDVEWFARHDGHRLMPINEYGELIGSCQRSVDCSCGTRRQCRLEHGHDGPCSPEKLR